MTKRKNAVQKTCDWEVSRVLDEVWETLRQSWENNAETQLCMKIDVRKSATNIICDMKKEGWNSANHKLSVFKIPDTTGQKDELSLL